MIGKWRIIEMELWGRDFIDADVPGYIQFDENGSGSFQFGYVEGALSCYYATEAVTFSWEGNSEMDEASGDGFAAIEDGILKGEISFDDGDESWFIAVR